MQRLTCILVVLVSICWLHQVAEAQTRDAAGDSTATETSRAKTPASADRPFLPDCIWDGCGWVLRDCRSGKTAVEQLELAVSFRARRRGLQYRGGMSANSGLLLAPANAIHTRHMCFAIDLTYLDCCGNVIATRRNVCPGRWFVPRVRGAYAVLETPAGASDIRVGQRLCVEQVSKQK